MRGCRRRRSAAYASMCGPLLPFLREGGPDAGGPDRRIIPGSVSGSVSGCRSDHIRSILQSPRIRAAASCRVGPNRVRSGRFLIRSHPINPIRSSPAGGGPFFSGTAGTYRVTVRNPGALCGRLGAGVVAYVPRYGAYVTLSRAPRGTALFPVHCCHSSLFVGSVWFAMVRFRGDLPAVSHCRAMSRRYAPVRGPGMARYGSVRRVGGASLRVTFSGRWSNQA